MLYMIYKLGQQDGAGVPPARRIKKGYPKRISLINLLTYLIT